MQWMLLFLASRFIMFRITPGATIHTSVRTVSFPRSSALTAVSPGVAEVVGHDHADERVVRWLAPLVMTLGLLTASCSKQDSAANANRRESATVSVITAELARVPVTAEWPGRLEAARTAQIRARVDGVVQRRLFEEGSDVKAGQRLFVLDTVPFKTALATALATEATTQAALLKARAHHERDRAHWEAKSMNAQDWEAAQASYRQAQADAAAAKAAVTQAKLNLAYATVKSPISGRIGRANISDGALVSGSEATLLATVQQTDTLYVNFAQPAVDALRLKREVEAAREQNRTPPQLHVVLEDGTVYPQAGQLIFNDPSVDNTSGLVTLRAAMPNPRGDLLPGLYVKVRIDLGRSDEAFLLPKQAVTRSHSGDTVMVVDTHHRVRVCAVQVGGTQGEHYVVTTGLKPGDQVVVEGFAKLRPQSTVTPVPWNAPPVAVSTSAHP